MSTERLLLVMACVEDVKRMIDRYGMRSDERLRRIRYRNAEMLAMMLEHPMGLFVDEKARRRALATGENLMLPEGRAHDWQVFCERRAA